MFKGYEAEHEGNNWIVLEKSDGAIVKEEFYRAEIDMCTILSVLMDLHIYPQKMCSFLKEMHIHGSCLVFKIF